MTGYDTDLHNRLEERGDVSRPTCERDCPQNTASPRLTTSFTQVRSRAKEFIEFHDQVEVGQLHNVVMLPDTYSRPAFTSWIL